MQTARDASARVPSAGYAWYALSVFVLANAFNFLDRQILAILVEPIQAELDVSDTEMGFLTGTAFSIFYTLAGIPLARLADRRSRVVLMSWSIAAWSALTAASGLARSFAQLAAARIGVGVGEATITPCTHSMVADLFPPERRARALSLLSVGANLGIVFGLGIVGVIAERYGWRAAFFAAGLPGLAVAALIALTVREPARGQSEGLTLQAERIPSFAEAMRFLWSRRSFRWYSLGASFQAFYGYAFLNWGPAFLGRVHERGVAEIGVTFGVVIGLGGALGAFLGGLSCDRLTPRDFRWFTWIPAGASLAMLPFALLFFQLEQTSLAYYAPAVIFGNFYAPIGYALAQGLAQVRMRATAAALILLIINFIGLLGPQLVGILNDALDPRFGSLAVRWSLSAVLMINALACLCYLLASRHVRAELALARAESGG
jgi:predicted MFS family arabinose efflux permease